MWLKWLPWRFIVSRLARSRGFIDPIALLARLHRFAQPSEVAEPIELLRAGVYFHARGLINSRTIQHNLDWVWPYWAQRQFDPHDPSFIPRAFSITHVNLSHRNWTAVGLPDLDALPVVDPRGLLTPLFDAWSLDGWVVLEDGPPLLPSRARHAEQRWRLGPDLPVQTDVRQGACRLRSTADVAWEGDRPVCRLRLEAHADAPGWLVLALRPANPEGVSFIHTVEHAGTTLRVNAATDVLLDRPPQRVCMSTYRGGDVLDHLGPAAQRTKITCDIGLATAAALYPLTPGETATVTARVALAGPSGPRRPQPAGAGAAWEQALAGACALDVPDERMRFLFDAAARSLVLHSPGEVYPGPYTYKRFWFRDAAFILEGLLALGLFDRVRRALEHFPQRQDRSGFFRSQEGEWDSNGEALWILDRYRRLSGSPLPDRLLRAAASGAAWIRRKRLPEEPPSPHAGLLPAGFSAEHLGPNDYYYWDDFWCAAGLRCAAAILRAGEPGASAPGGGAVRQWEREADGLLAAVDASVALAAQRCGGAVPASPYRRMDSGAVGSLAASYPLRLWQPRDPRLLALAEFLLAHCLVRGGFFQDMIHSGINAYLTLELAQVLLRAGDGRHAALVRAVADLASPTGQWPEAIHPHTGGGCMGDGHHVWASAEWVLMMRSLFVREEGEGLVLASGLFPEWLSGSRPLRLGPTPTPFGPITVTVQPDGEAVRVSWRADWRGKPPPLWVAVPGCEPVPPAGSVAEFAKNSASVVLRRTGVREVIS
jgi:hypothetical protein